MNLTELLESLERSQKSQCVCVLHDSQASNYNEPIFVLVKEVRPNHKVFFESFKEIRNEKGLTWKPKFDYYISDLVGLINQGRVIFLEDRNYIECVNI